MAQKLLVYQERKKKFEMIGLAMGVLIVLGILLLIFTDNALGTVGAVLLVLGIIGVLISVIGFNKVVSDFKSKYLKDYFASVIEQGEFRPKRGMAPQKVYGCGFLKRADKFKSYDYLGGVIDGVEFESTDAHLQEKRVRYYTVNGKRRRKVEYVTFFKGRIFAFDFPKSIDHPLQVLENFRPQDGRKYDKVELESITFNKTFKTYAMDKHTAFYVLTPHFMERLLNIEEIHPGKLGFSFMDNKMYFAINNNRSTFPVMPFKKIDESLVEEFKKDVDIVYDLVDDLKLNESIFKEDK